MPPLWSPSQSVPNLLLIHPPSCLPEQPPLLSPPFPSLPFSRGFSLCASARPTPLSAWRARIPPLPRRLLRACTSDLTSSFRLPSCVSSDRPATVAICRSVARRLAARGPLSLSLSDSGASLPPSLFAHLMLTCPWCYHSPCGRGLRRHSSLALRRLTQVKEFAGEEWEEWTAIRRVEMSLDASFERCNAMLREVSRQPQATRLVSEGDNGRRPSLSFSACLSSGSSSIDSSLASPAARRRPLFLLLLGTVLLTRQTSWTSSMSLPRSGAPAQLLGAPDEEAGVVVTSLRSCAVNAPPQGQCCVAAA